MSTLMHKTRTQELNLYTSTDELFTFDSGHTTVSIHVTDYVVNEGEVGSDFTRADIHITPADGRTFIDANKFDSRTTDPFWTLNVGPVTLYLTPEDRRQIIDALIDGIEQ